ncbi:alpha/beta hydrolase [Streptomyces sp. NPDC006326]|uniref:alpha/beta hydrolase n=1 Tax=Streptomyces sp. NPDC006326 TaxID=3156752 RepID=UPI0033A28B8E
MPQSESESESESRSEFRSQCQSQSRSESTCESRPRSRFHARVLARAGGRSRAPARGRSRARIAVVVGGGAALLAASLGVVQDPRPGIRWGECAQTAVPAGMRCGTLDVPLDHARPGKGVVRVALAKLPATGHPGRRLGSLLLNFGGPGAPGIAGLAADPTAFADLGERYDLVAFDPRGVGHSEPVSCGGSQETDPASDTDAAARLAALRAVVRRCELASGPVLPYIGTVNVSRDLDRIRQALGETKLNYLGFSYGTRLGAVYAAQFPRTTGRMVLDGVDTLTEPPAERALVTARGRQQALDGFLAWCARRKDCVYGADPRAARDKVGALVSRLDAEPLVGEDGSYFTGQDAVAALAAALDAKQQQTWPALAAGLALVERERDPGGLLRLGAPTQPPRGESDGAGPVTPVSAVTPVASVTPMASVPPVPPVPADNGEAALTAVNCADHPGRSRATAGAAAFAEEIDGLEEDFRRASPIFGPQQLAAVLSCYGRPAGTDFLRRIDRPAGLPRMLLVGTRGDPATPYRWTQETARRLGGPAVVLDHRGAGRTGYSASRCVREHVNRFLVDGHLPAGTNRSCPAGR